MGIPGIGGAPGLPGIQGEPGRCLQHITSLDIFTTTPLLIHNTKKILVHLVLSKSLSRTRKLYAVRHFLVPELNC